MRASGFGIRDPGSGIRDEGFDRASAHGQFAFHVAAAFVLGEIAIEVVVAGAVGAELENDGLPRARALGDAVAVYGEAVRDIDRREGDLHEVVFLDVDLRRVEPELVRLDRNLACRLRFRRGAVQERPEHGAGRGESCYGELVRPQCVHKRSPRVTIGAYGTDA